MTEWVRLSRRQLFQVSAAAGAFLTPLLRGRAAEAAAAFPRRLVFFHVPLGAIRESWIPTGSESNFSLSTCLQPMAPHKDKLLVIDGINFGTRAHNHHEAGSCLTGSYCSGADGTSKHTNISIDQYIKSKLPDTARLKAIELMTHDRKWSTLYADRHLFSARGPALPVIPEANPQIAFDRVFAGVKPSSPSSSTVDPAIEQRRVDRRSVLDVVSKELAALGPRLSASEQAKLDQHMTAIRELEKRLQAPEAGETIGGIGAMCTVPTKPTVLNAYDNATLPERVKANIQLVTYGMACDQMRVAVMGNESGQGRSKPVWVGYNTNWHDAYTHDRTGRVEHTKITTWWVAQFAYMVGLFKSIPEGSGTMLDNSTLVLFSEQGCRYLDGGGYSEHSDKNLPFLVAGSGGGYFKQNRFVNAGGVVYKNFLFNCLRAMGYSESTFGSVSGTPIAGLAA